APGRRFGLQLADVSDGSVVLLLAHQNAVTRGDVFVLEIAVGPPRIRGDRNIMPHEPHLGVIALWRKPSNILLAGWLTDTAEDHKSVAVVPGLAGTELEVVLAGSAGGSHAPRILRLGAGLRVSHREANSRHDDQCQWAKQPRRGPTDQLLPHDGPPVTPSHTQIH